MYTEVVLQRFRAQRKIRLGVENLKSSLTPGIWEFNYFRKCWGKKKSLFRS